MTRTANVQTIYDSAASLASTHEDFTSLISPGEPLRFGVVGTGCIGARGAAQRMLGLRTAARARRERSRAPTDEG